MQETLQTLDSFWRNSPEAARGLAALLLALIFLAFYAATNRKRDRSRDVNLSGAWPWILVLGGLGLAGYFFLLFDPSLPVPFHTAGLPDRVNNLGLMNQRQNGIIIGVGLSLLGAVFVAINSRSSR
jgi:drug/metabolite transporter (DMT)-like permease